VIVQNKKKRGRLAPPSSLKCRNSAYGGLQILLGLSNFVQFRSVLPFGFWPRAFFPLLFIDVFRVYLKEPRVPIESPKWHDRFFWQNPVRVTRPVPLGRCPLSSTLSASWRVSPSADSHSVRSRPFDRFRLSCDSSLSASGFHV